MWKQKQRTSQFMISQVVPLCNFRRAFWLLNNAARDKLPESYGIISPRDDTLKFRTWHALVDGRSVEVGRFFCLWLVLNGMRASRQEFWIFWWTSFLWLSFLPKVIPKHWQYLIFYWIKRKIWNISLKPKTTERFSQKILKVTPLNLLPNCSHSKRHKTPAKTTAPFTFLGTIPWQFTSL